MESLENKLDPRIHAFRSDLADIELKGHIQAERYIEGQLKMVSVPVCDLYNKPLISSDTQVISQVCYGEQVLVFECDMGEGGQWSWVQNKIDGYVGYTPSPNLQIVDFETNYKVAAPRVSVMNRPDVKGLVVATLPFGAYVNVIDEQDDYMKISGSISGWIYHGQLMKSADYFIDPIRLSQNFVGVPYIWGGRSGDGFDCSGFIQQIFTASNNLGNISCPRDSDMMENKLGDLLSSDDQLIAGDLIFWHGHVGMMIDKKSLIHANIYTMSIAIEDLAKVDQRLSQKNFFITNRKRIISLHNF